MNGEYKGPGNGFDHISDSASKSRRRCTQVFLNEILSLPNKPTHLDLELITAVPKRMLLRKEITHWEVFEVLTFHPQHYDSS